MSKKRQQTIVTFVIEGRDDRREVTINFIPGFLLIILRGRSARSALRAFSDYKLDAILACAFLSSPVGLSILTSSFKVCSVTIKSTNDAITTTKSMIFQGFLMYETNPFSLNVELLKKNPKAIILTRASNVNNTVKQLSR